MVHTNTKAIFIITADVCTEILIRYPENQSVSLNTNASFHCEIRPDQLNKYEVDWIVQLQNGSVYHIINLLTLQEVGFIPVPEGEIIGSSLTMNVLAMTENNNSRIRCRLFSNDLSQVCFTDFATLTVISK